MNDEERSSRPSSKPIQKLRSDPRLTIRDEKLSCQMGQFSGGELLCRRVEEVVRSTMLPKMFISEQQLCGKVK